MHDRTDEKRLSNEELIAALAAALRKEGNLIASVIAMLIEVEERRLHLELACPSLFDFCVRRLGMSEGEAYRRITVARLARRFPEVLDAVRCGRVHLSNLVLLRDLLTRENVSELLEAAAGKTKRAVQELVARLAPKPDVPDLIRKLPMQTTASVPVTAPVPPLAPAPALAVPSASASPRTQPASVAAQVAPLAESRHKVSFTVSSELREKLERAQSLMRHRNVEGDLAVVVERAIDLLITKLEKEKLAATVRPKREAIAPAPSPTAGGKAPPPPATSGISAAARREVLQRDDERCSFVGTNGERCSARDFLEIDHRHPRALGGSHDVENLRLLCRAHNRYAAEQAFGREHIARAIDVRRRKRDARRATSADATHDAQPMLPMT